MQTLSKSYQSKRDNVFPSQMTLHAVLNSLTQYLGLGSTDRPQWLRCGCLHSHAHTLLPLATGGKEHLYFQVLCSYFLA